MCKNTGRNQTIGGRMRDIKSKIISSLKDVQVTQVLAQNSILKIEDVHSYMILNFVKRTIQYQLSRNEARGQLHVSDFKLISILREFMDMKLIEISKRTIDTSYFKKSGCKKNLCSTTFKYPYHTKELNLLNFL